MVLCCKRLSKELLFLVVLSHALASDTSGSIRHHGHSEKSKGAGTVSPLSVEESGPDRERTYTVGHPHVSETHSRQLKQRENIQQETEGFNCSLSRAEIEEIYDRRTRVWRLSESRLVQNVDIIQAAINCSADNDVILMSTNRTLQPSNTVVIPWNLTFSADPRGSLVQDGEIIEADTRVRFTCPSDGDLLSIRASVRIASIVFAECNNDSNIVSLDIACENGDEISEVHLQHVEFQDNMLPGNKWIIESADPSCTRLFLRNVGVVRNQCGRMGCISLTSVNTVVNVKIEENSVATSAAVSHGVFNSSVGSNTTATSVSAVGNQIRVFNLIDSTLSISDSLFRGNGASNSNLLDLSDGGSVLLSSLSRVAISNSQFEDNSGPNGGALFVRASQINILDCTLQQNSASGGNGGAISARYGSTVVLVATNLYDNRAQYGGACDFDQTTVTMRNLTFRSNSVSDTGGAVYNSGGELNGENLRFFDNRAAESGGSIHCIYTPHVVLSSTQFHNNNGSYGGAVSAYNTALELRPSCNFTMNHGIEDGGSIYLSNSTASITSCYFRSNEARNGGTMWIGVRSRSNIENNTFEDGTAVFNGGAIYICQTSSMNVSSSRFLGHQARIGGAIYSTDSFNSTISNCTFGDNNARLRGGAISAYSDSTILMYNTSIHDNEAEEGGGIHVASSNSTLSGCNLIDNSANSSGGAIYGRTGRIEIIDAHFSSNRAHDGAGLYLLRMSAIEMDSSLLEHNHATDSGGATYIEDGPARASISNCNFTANHASNGSSLFFEKASARILDSHFEGNNATDSGAGLYLSESNLTMRRSVLLSNVARSCAGICVHSNSMLSGRAIILLSNVASEEGGGIGVRSPSRCLCRDCEFRNNSAVQGAGLYADSEDSTHSEGQLNYIPILAQLQDSIFEDNNALEFGDLTVSCGRIVLLDTLFNNNIASYGSALMTTHPADVLISCNYNEQESSWLDVEELKSLSVMSPERMCTFWKGTGIAKDSNNGVIGTYGVKWNFSTPSEREVRIVHDKEEGFVLENLRSGELLPVIYVSMLDAYGTRPMQTTPDSFKVEVSSPSGYVRGNVTITISGGNGTLRNISNLKPPGSYTLEFHPIGVAIPSATLQIRISYCQLDEQLTTGDLCQPCDALSYNFDPIKGTCTSCPNDANCQGRYIKPNDGYWHQSPCHARVMRCLNEEACQREQRQARLETFTQEFSDCNMSHSVLMSYHEILCREGYQGPLCGSCQKGHGLSLEFQCSECPHDIWSLLTIVFLALYLLVLASFTIRGSLPNIPTIITQSSRPISTTSVICNSTRSAAVSIQMVETTRGHPPLEVISPNSQTSASDEEDSQEIMDLEITRWIRTETLKILINFLQVTSIAATINVQWTDEVLAMFEASEYVGALTTAALSRPIDCFLGTRSSTSRSIWRTLVGLFVPGTVMGVFVLFWGCKAMYGSEGFAFFWKRTLLSIVAVTYISYLGLTKLAVRTFYCVDVYDSGNIVSNSTTARWAVDTSIQCYGKDHSGLIVIGSVVLLIVSISFPLIFAFIIVKNKLQTDQRKGWMFETMGFLYRAFKEKFVFWECIAMLRKACLSIIVVFSYPLGSLSQGLLAQIVLVISLCVHLKCLPYREEFHRLNTYEFGSLLVCCLTFLLGQFFNDEKREQFTRSLVAFLIVSMNVLFSLFLVSVLLVSGLDHIKVVLKSEGFPVDDNSPAWKVIKVYVVSRIRRCCQSTT